eukprot:3340-Eustigmatos_ZCMA.PRE.1
MARKRSGVRRSAQTGKVECHAAVMVNDDDGSLTGNANSDFRMYVIGSPAIFLSRIFHPV